MGAKEKKLGGGEVRDYLVEDQVGQRRKLKRVRRVPPVAVRQRAVWSDVITESLAGAHRLLLLGHFNAVVV
jgi:hypothetical protein